VDQLRFGSATVVARGDAFMVDDWPELLPI
jgi:hypothetical protein